MKTRLSYAVHSTFLTLQGEGCWAGHRAVFVRFAGCNVWTGNEEHRERDTANGCCAAWCDTEFRGTRGDGGGTFTKDGLVKAVLDLWGHVATPGPLQLAAGQLGPNQQRSRGEPLVVFTGGEPGLQLDDALVDAMRAAGVRVHVETNGSCQLPAFTDWVTLSPKPPMQVVTQRYDELKVVVPAVDPLRYQHHSLQRFVQPQDCLDIDQAEENKVTAMRFVMTNPQWALSLQTHKILEIP